MSNRVIILVGALFSATFVWTGASASLQDKPSREDYNSGAHLYREFCASCHGETGKGDGPVAGTLPKRATDLTLLARRNGGVSPRPDVLAVVEGTRPIPEHARPGMPNWRDMFYRLERGDERAVQQRLDALVRHVESLQDKR